MIRRTSRNNFASHLIRSIIHGHPRSSTGKVEYRSCFDFSTTARDERRSLGSDCDKMKWRNDLSPGIRAGDGYIGEGGHSADERSHQKQGEVLHGVFPVEVRRFRVRAFGLQDHTSANYSETPLRTGLPELFAAIDLLDPQSRDSGESV